MHYVFVLVYQQRTVCNRHNIRNLIRRCTDNGLQAHPSQETDALNNAITIHFVKCLIKHCQSDGVAETGCIVHTVELSEGSQNRNIKRSLCFTAGLCVQGLRKQLLCSVLIRGFQVKLQVCPKIGILRYPSTAPRQCSSASSRTSARISILTGLPISLFSSDSKRDFNCSRPRG